MKRKGRFIRAAMMAVTISGMFTISVNASEPEQLFPDSIEASSMLVEEGTDYSPWNLVDNQLETAWAEGVSGTGVGEYVDFYFPEGTEITQVSIWPGWYRSSELFLQNGAPTKLEIAAGGQSFLLSTASYASALADGGVGCTFNLTSPLVSDGTVRLTIKEVRDGSVFQDTCISELHLMGHPAQSAPQTAPAETEPAVTSEPAGTSEPGAYLNIEQLASFAGELYQAYIGTDVPVDASIIQEDLTPQLRALMMYWYQYMADDSRITRDVMTNRMEYHDMADIMMGLFGVVTTDDINVFLNEYVLSRTGNSLEMNGTGDFGDAGTFFFDDVTNQGYDGEYLLLTGNVVSYDNVQGTYIPAESYAVYYSWLGEETLQGWQLVEIIVGDEAEDAAAYFQGTFDHFPGDDAQTWETEHTGSDETVNQTAQTEAPAPPAQTEAPSAQTEQAQQTETSAPAETEEIYNADADIPEKLAAMALDYYERNYGYRPAYCDCEDNHDGSYTLHLYDIVQGHTATSAWYDVNENGSGKDIIMGDYINLNF